MNRNAFVLSLTFSVALASSNHAQVQPSVASREGIVVRGVGDVRVKPNVLEIDMRATGRAELTGDALVKFRDSCSNTMKAFEKLGVEELEIKELGVSVVNGTSSAQMQAMMRGTMNTNTKMEVEIGRTLRLSVGGIAKLPEEKLIQLIGKLIDIAKDSGAAIGPGAADMNMAYRYGRTVNGALARFVLIGFEEHEDAAYKAAITDARRQATRLATLSGVQLGRISSVEVLASPTESRPPVAGTVVYAGQPAPVQSAPKPRLVSESLEAIGVTVRLQVRFEIE